VYLFINKKEKPLVYEWFDKFIKKESNINFSQKPSMFL
jgi:hypothetical protein